MPQISDSSVSSCILPAVCFMTMVRPLSANTASCDQLQACFCYTEHNVRSLEWACLPWEHWFKCHGEVLCGGKKNTGARKLNNQHSNLFRLLFISPLTWCGFPGPAEKIPPSQRDADSGSPSPATLLVTQPHPRGTPRFAPALDRRGN